jgi:hypothetical protein
MYALGSTTPLHVTSVPYVSHAYVALDSHGDLCEANGNVTAPAIYAYDARTLKLERSRGGAGAGPLAADQSGYLYEASGGAYVLVYAPGCTHYLNAINNCVCGPSVFDQSGNLYAGSDGVRVYAPTQKSWHMKLMRVIEHGINGPVALAVGPSEQLFVVNYGGGSSPPSASLRPAARSRSGESRRASTTLMRSRWIQKAGCSLQINLQRRTPVGYPSTRPEARAQFGTSRTTGGVSRPMHSLSTHQITCTLQAR